MAPQLTDDEVHALDLTAELANTMRRVIGTEGDCWEHDWNEVARIIHDLQSRIVGQLGSRTDPIYTRPLGGWVR